MSPPPRPREEHPLFNPDAGTHDLPDDPREIEAVLAASARSFEANPYFLARYGARGLAFTHSDGGYLVSLTKAPQSHVHEQVAWLCDLLAARGMPSWLMEEHLHLLHEELRRRVDDRTVAYARLRRAAIRLQRLREARLAAADFEAIAARFEAAAGPGLAHAGRLVVGAVCDERGGRDRAVPSLVKWLGDPLRFSAQWCGALAVALAQARSAPWPGRH